MNPSLSGRSAYGALLTLLSVLIWGSQPLAIALAIRAIPAPSLAFFKLGASAVALGSFLAARGALPSPSSLARRTWLGLAVAAVSLALSSLAYNASYRYISGSNAQVYSLMSKILLSLAGIVLFRERFSRAQWFGLALLVSGLGFFYHDQLLQSGGSNYALGVLIVLFSAASWAVYGVLQKQLMREIPPPSIMLFVYVGAALTLSPTAASFTHAPSLTESVALFWVCASNLLAFACFTESLRHWEASKVGAVSCLAPLVTIAFILTFQGYFPQLKPEGLGFLSWLGAVMAVGGATFVGWAGKQSHAAR